MSRYSVEYDPQISVSAKAFIIKNLEPESRNDNTSIYNLDYVLELDWSGRDEDYKYLLRMAEDEEVPPDYIEF